jgi:hypothetical protein
LAGARRAAERAEAQLASGESDAKKKALDTARGQFEAAQKRVSATSTRLATAENLVAEAKKAQGERLSSAVAAAEAAVVDHQRKLDDLERNLALEAEKGRQIVERATRPSLGSEAAVFIRLLIRDRAVLLMTTLILLAAIAVDSLVLGIKLALRGGTHDQLVVIRDEHTLAESKDEVEEHALERDTRLFDLRSGADARALFHREDGGAIAAEKMLIEQQAAVDRAVTLAVLDHVAELRERAVTEFDEIEVLAERAGKSSRIVGALKSNLESALSAIEARLAQFAKTFERTEQTKPQMGGDD